MSGFTGFPFSNNNNSSSSTPSFVFGSSSTQSPSFTSFGSTFATPNFGSFSSPPSFGSSNNATFSFGPSSSSSSLSSLLSSSSYSTATNQVIDEATIKNVNEAVEVLEKLAKNGTFPQQKLKEIKLELEKKYPSTFSTYPNNNNFPMSSNVFNQEEYYDNYLRAQEQQMNHYVQAQMSQIRNMEQQLKVFGETTETARGLSPNYDANYDDNQVSDVFGSTSLGSEGLSALSFLSSFLGGFGSGRI